MTGGPLDPGPPPQPPDPQRFAFDVAPAWLPRPARRKFQHNYRRHLILFLLTWFTTTWSWSLGTMWTVLVATVMGELAPGASISPFVAFTWPNLLSGLAFSVPLLIILSAHEFGHYFACRYYDVDATLPYYLPAPIPPAGTFGAVIRIREPFPSKRALFDIGVAGPLAGFVALIPFLLWGLSLSSVAPVPPDSGVLYFGEPLLWKALAWLYFGPVPDGMDVMLHPVGLAAWWGLLATALNLLPFGQLDGGHIMYAAIGRRAGQISVATLAVVLVLTLVSSSWLMMAGLMVLVALAFGFRHPLVPDEHVPLDRTRLWIAVLAAAILVLCFMPEPLRLMP